MLDLNPGDSVLAVAPHCDDETLGAGGTLARLAASGARVCVLVACCETMTTEGGCCPASVRAAELERARKLLARGESPEAVLEQLAHGLTQKYLHGPLAALNRSEGDDRKQLLAWMPRLFPGRDSRR